MESQCTFDIDADEEENYVNNQGGFQCNSQWNQGQNFYDKPDYKDREQGNWRRNNDRSGLYVPPESRDVAPTRSCKMSMEDVKEKLLKGVEVPTQG